MSSASPTQLQQAVDNYRAALSPYPSSSEKAVSELLMALVAEIAARPTDPGAAPGPAAASAEQADLQSLHAELAALSAKVSAVRRDLLLMAEISKTEPAERNPGGELQALRREVASLRRQLNGSQPNHGSQPNRRVVELPGSLAPMVPVEELLNDAPQMDESVSAEQMKAYIARPRVRAEDIQLTEDERKQLRRPYRTKLSPSLSVREQSRTPQDLQTGIRIGPILFALIALIVLIMLINSFSQY
jgi:hypothetical protein